MERFLNRFTPYFQIHTVLGYLDAPFKVQLSYLVILALIASFLEAIGVSIAYVIIHYLSNPGTNELPEQIETLITWMDLNFVGNTTFVLAAALAVFYLFKNMFLLFAAYFQYTFADSAAAHLAKRLMELYLSTNYENLLDRNSSDLITNINDATYVVSTRILMPLTVVVSESFTIVAILAVLIASNPGITLVSVIFIGSILVGHNLIMRNFYHRWEQTRLDLYSCA